MDTGDREANPDHIRAWRIDDLVAPALADVDLVVGKQCPHVFHAHRVGNPAHHFRAGVRSIGAGGDDQPDRIDHHLLVRAQPDAGVDVPVRTLDAVDRLELAVVGEETGRHQRRRGRRRTGLHRTIACATGQHGTCGKHRPHPRFSFHDPDSPLFRSPTGMPKILMQHGARSGRCIAQHRGPMLKHLLTN